MKQVWLTTKSRYSQSEERRFAKLRRGLGGWSAVRASGRLSLT